MIIVNEVEFAERCLKEGLCGEKPYKVASILARYYYHEKRLKPKQIKAKLSDFLETYDETYARQTEQWLEKMPNIIKYAKEHPLHHITGVSIRKSEMELIGSLHNRTLERLAFTLLCLAKFNNLKNAQNDNWVNYDWKTIFNLAHISGGDMERAKKLSALAEAGFTERSHLWGNNSSRVVYVTDEGEEVLFVSDFRELGYEYVNYRSGGFIRCGECDRLFKPSYYNQLYCSECQGYTKQAKRLVICEDCGKAFFTSSKATKTTRCAECKRDHTKEYQRDLMRKRREQARC